MTYFGLTQLLYKWNRKYIKSLTPGALFGSNLLHPDNLHVTDVSMLFPIYLQHFLNLHTR